MRALCDSCAHQQLVPNTRGSVFSLCRRSRTEPERFARYPPMPVLECVGFTVMSPTPQPATQQHHAADRAAQPPARVTALSVTAVKGMRLQTTDAITLTRQGARGDRRLFMIDARSRMVNGKQLPALMQLSSQLDEQRGELTISFPDGRRLSAVIEPGEPVGARAYGDIWEGTLVDGPWNQALSEHAGQPLRLVASACATDRGEQGAVSLISRASLARLAQEAGAERVDARRFRMTIEFDGVAAHAEDQWIGRELAVGGARLRVEGHIGRCLVTSRDPESGEITLPTLDLLRAYRAELQTTEPLAFGIHASVLRAGEVRVGDSLLPVPGDAAER